MAFRFTNWMRADHDWSGWLNWFRRINVLAWVETNVNSQSAVFREGAEAKEKEENIDEREEAAR